jgi:methylated-DNA-[protein]-cysteine S-methyltransferase
VDSAGYCLFETPLGTCAIAWGKPLEPGGRPAVTLLQLPETTAATTEARVARLSRARKVSAPPPDIAEVMDRICKHLRGDVQDFRGVAVNLDGLDPFTHRVYELVREIPAGETRTYGDIARALDVPGAARAVGQSMGKNPVPLIIPCHRVMAAGGRTGGFSAPGGRDTKARLLSIEGAMLPLFRP